MPLRRQSQTWRRKVASSPAAGRVAAAARWGLLRGRHAWKASRRALRGAIKRARAMLSRSRAVGAILARRSVRRLGSLRRRTSRALHQALAYAAASPAAAHAKRRWDAARDNGVAAQRILRQRTTGLAAAGAFRLQAAAVRPLKAGWYRLRAGLRQTPLGPALARLDRWLVARRRPRRGRYRIAVATPRSRYVAIAVAALLGLLGALPAFAGRDLVNDLIFVFTMLALAQYWNLLAGYAGLVSVGQQAFVGLGGYLLFALSVHGGVDPLAAIVLAGVVAAVLALPTALVVFRLRGAYFAIGTWVMAEVYRLVFAQFRQLGGGTGTSLPPFVTNEVAGIAWVKSTFDVRTSAARDVITYWTALALAAGTILLVYLILRSRYGLALAAIRDSETAAESVGVDNFRTKLKVYVATAAGTGMVGALIYLQKARISPDAAFSVLDWTAYVIFIVVIGGIGTIEGPIVGVLVFYVLQTNLAHFGTWYLILLGLFAILTMLFAPAGIWGYISARYGLAILPTRRRLVVENGHGGTPPAPQTGPAAPEPDSGLGRSQPAR